MILYEHNFSNVEYLPEQSENDGEKFWYMNGIFMQANKQNGNGRVYTNEEMRREVEKINSKISQGKSVLGECDHPGKLEVSMKNASHVIQELRMDGDNVYGKAKVLKTPSGQIVEGLMKSGVQVGVSSRGSGQVLEDGTVKDFNLITVDVVSDPSAPDAYPETVEESIMLSKHGYSVYKLAEELQNDKDAQKYFEKEFHKWLEEKFN
jgi:hypothetical protein